MPVGVPVARVGAGDRCLNPTCSENCTWPTAKGEGRSKLLCSKRCRQMHDRVRDCLRAAVEGLKVVTARAM